MGSGAESSGSLKDYFQSICSGQLPIFLPPPLTQTKWLSCVYPQAGTGQLFSKEIQPSVWENLVLVVRVLEPQRGNSF